MGQQRQHDGSIADPTQTKGPALPADAPVRQVYCSRRQLHRVFESLAEAQAFDEAFDAYPDIAARTQTSGVLMSAATSGWHAADRRRRLELESREDDVVRRAREAGL